jgi:hypothetical protein
MEEEFNMKLKCWQKNILSMLIIIGVGFILFNVAFLLAYFVNTAYNTVIMQFIDKAGNARLIHFSWHYVYLILILLLSWFVLTRRLNDLVKATFSTMPLIVVLTEVGVQFYHWPVLVWVIGAVIVSSVLLYLYKTKRSWLYYFATFYVVAVEVFVMISGMDI